jgi:hypothetical protein
MKGGTNKKLHVLSALCLATVIPSFGAEHVVTRLAKVVGHETYEAAKNVGHAGIAVVKFLV